MKFPGNVFTSFITIVYKFEPNSGANKKVLYILVHRAEATVTSNGSNGRSKNDLLVVEIFRTMSEKIYKFNSIENE